MKNERWLPPIPQRRRPPEAPNQVHIEPPDYHEKSVPKDRNERQPEMGGKVDITPKDDSGEDDGGKDYSGDIF